jgi:two-component system sensor histidine kinase
MKVFLLFILFFLSGVLGCVQYVEGETGVPPEIRRVLFVCSYHSEQIWGRKVLNGVKKQLDRAGYNVDLRVIYLDSKRLTNTEVRNSLLEVQLREVKGKLDLIIVSDEEANNALFSLDIPLVKETPIVFCGVMRYSKKLDFDQVTGVICDIDYEKVFLLGRKLFPEARKVYVFSDQSGAGQAHEALARQQLAKYKDRFPVVFAGDSILDVNSFLKELQEVYPLSFVILTTWQQGKQGVYLDPDIYYSMYAHECPVPILTVMDNGLGKGIFGGIVTFADQMGTKAGKIGVRILNGEQAKAIPIDTVHPIPVFDENQLKRWRVERKNLPVKSLIVNERDAFWRTYGNYILIAGITFILLLLLVLFLVLSHLRYRKMLHRSIFLEKAAQRMAEMLKKKTEILSNTLSSMSEGILVVDKELRVIELNHASVVGLGCEGDVIGKPLKEVCEINRNRGGEGIEDFVQKVMGERMRRDLALNTVLIPCGAPVQQVTGSVSPLLNESGEVNGAVIMLRDVTREWQQQTFLRISINALRAYSWCYDVNNNIMTVGESFPKDETLSRDLSTIEKYMSHIHPDDRGELLACLEGITKDELKEFVVIFRVDYLCPGEYRWLENRGIVETVEMSNGRKAKYVYGMGIDINRYKVVEEKMAIAMRKAEESDRLKSAFVANISHEIRTPLNSIVGFANLMVEEGLPEEERKLSSDMITSNSRALLGLLDDVLDLSRLEAGMDKVFLCVCDLHFLVHSMLDIGRLNMAQGVELVNEGPREKLLVMTDEVKLTKVFMNLIGNAKKFTTQGHIVIGAKITSDGVWVECWVKDTGIGISPENLEHIFDRFYKVNEFKQGTGLGLSICEAIIELLGGQIWVESTLGKGTTFYFRIPYRKPKEEGI